MTASFAPPPGMEEADPAIENDRFDRAPDGRRWLDAFSREEIDSLLEMQDWRSWLSVFTNWALVFAAMAMVAAWPNPLTVIVALFVIGARQLGMAVMMHEASHRSLFANKRTNDFVGNWLAAYPVWSDLNPYRPYHLQHHAHTGSPKDPDLGLIKPFPITRKSLWRKVWRDLSGQTGVKFAKGSWSRTFGQMHEEQPRRAAIGVLVTNAVLFGILWLAGAPWLYLLWVGAWLTTNTLVTRIRSIAEHALTPDAADPLRNTRTTLANPLERLFIAPNAVNYHLEHHLLMTVPHYHLKRMHHMLREKGILEDACVARGYRGILRNAASKPSPAQA
ncbi:MAG: fatty acid desaturase family protein [Myxococcota bacterium]|nr:fatty acid desaturase family protein [Myxococcota bacterium]